MNTSYYRAGFAAHKLGFWVSITMLSSLLVYIICFMAISLTSELFIWNNFEDYLSYYQSNNQLFSNAAKLFMIIFGTSFLLLIAVFHEFAQKEQKIWSHISLCFAVAFMVTTSIHYFVQLSGVRFAINEANVMGIEHFLQANPHSMMASVNMLGWTVFLGLSSLFLIPMFSKSQKLLKMAFLMNGINGLLGAFAYVFDVIPILAFTAYIGFGACSFMIAFGALRMFRS